MSRATVATVDTKGELCPVPVVKLALAIEELQPGETVELIATDPGSKADIPAWAEMTGHTLLRAEHRGDIYIFLVQKT